MNYEAFYNENAERLPGLLQPHQSRAVTFGKALSSWTRSGFAATPPETLAEREATCRACPEWDAEALNKTGRCRKCGCSTWAKLRMATERCPLGKWESFDTPPPEYPCASTSTSTPGGF